MLFAVGHGSFHSFGYWQMSYIKVRAKMLTRAFCVFQRRIPGGTLLSRMTDMQMILTCMLAILSYWAANGWPNDCYNLFSDGPLCTIVLVYIILFWTCSPLRAQPPTGGQVRSSDWGKTRIWKLMQCVPLHYTAEMGIRKRKTHRQDGHFFSSFRHLATWMYFLY